MNAHNDLDTATNERAAKHFHTLRAQLAMHGHVLHRTESKDGAITYYCHKWGLVRHFQNLDAVDAFLTQVGGVDHA